MSGASALILGGGPGLGAALVRRFRAAGLAVAVASRRRERLVELFADDPAVRCYQCDATDANAVTALVGAVEAELGPLDLAVYNAAGWMLKGFLEIPPAEVEQLWRIGCLGAFQFAQAAGRVMVPRGRGTILFTGSSAQLRAGANFSAMTIAKSGLRSMSQSIARELGPQGIHVAHIAVDGGIDSERTRANARDPNRLVDPAGIAEAYHFLYAQPRAAWTNDLDMKALGTID